MATLTQVNDQLATTRNWSTLGTTFYRHQLSTVSEIAKSTGSGIGAPSAINGSGGSVTFLGYNNDAATGSWSGDGTPTASGSDQDGQYTGGTVVVGSGIQWVCTADTSVRTYGFYLGMYSAGGTFSAVLSDGSASMSNVSFADTTFNVSADCNVVLTVQAGSAGQTLTVQWTIASLSAAFGNVTMRGQTLSIAAGASSVGPSSAPPFMVVGPGRFRSPMGVGRAPGATSSTTTLVTLALSGSAMTSSTGAPVANASYSATGSALTGSTGTPVSNVSYAATGSGVTASRGTPVSNVSYAASGSGLTASAGTTTANLAALPAGSAATFAAGTLTSALSYTLTGSQGATAAGTVVAAISRSLSGTSATTATGTVLSNISAALTGSGVTGSTGTPVANISLSASGSGLTVIPGTVTIGSNVTIALAGQSMTVSAGTAGVVVTVPLAGLGLTVSAGTVTQSGGSTVTFARNAILFSGEKSVLPAAREWKRTHDN